MIVPPCLFLAPNRETGRAPDFRNYRCLTFDPQVLHFVLHPRALQSDSEGQKDKDSEEEDLLGVVLDEEAEIVELLLEF